MSGFTHFDAQGNAIMVDVTDKDITERCATASGCIRVSREVFDAVKDGTAKKGDVLGTARIAGIMAAKRTWELIPLCHPLMLTKVTIDFVMEEDGYTDMEVRGYMTQDMLVKAMMFINKQLKVEIKENKK